MNYIKRLQEDNKLLSSNISHAEERLLELNRYINSSKFRCGDQLDGYVNITDVARYIETVNNHLRIGR